MIPKKIVKLTFVLCLTSLFQMNAQGVTYNGNPDTSFETARKLAFNGQRKQAQDTLSHILTKYPDYHDIREFLATTYSWDGDYKKARKEFDYILKKDSQNKTSWIASIKNQLWGDAPYIALEMANEALGKFPNDSELLYLKASAQEKTNNPLEAFNTIQLILDANPEDKKANEYKLSLNDKLRKNTIGFRASVDLYSETFDPMQYYTLEYSRQTKYGSIIAKANFNRRFNENGMQYEVDLYPKIAKGLYAYLNFGLANTFLFPEMRYGAELYQSLPKSFEVSLGFRTLKYSTTTNIYTGSVGWYTGNSYWSFRPYLTPGDSGISTSGTLVYRKYGRDANNFIGLSAGIGFSPENNQFNNDNTVSPIITLKSQKIKIDYNFTSSNNRNIWGTQFGITHQEKSFDQGSYFWIYSASIFWDVKFK